MGEVDDGVENGGCSGGGGDSGEGMATLEEGHARLEDVGGGVADTCVDIAELLQSEQVGSVLGVLELLTEHGGRGEGGSRSRGTAGGMKKRFSREERLRRLTDLVRGGAVEGNAAGGTLTETIYRFITVGVVATVKGDRIKSCVHVERTSS